MPPGSARDYRKQGGFFLLADGAGIYAVTAICTHNGCKVHLAAGQGFSCPCHDSAYDLQGNVTQGPARRPLKHLAVAEPSPGGPLVVDLGQEVEPHVRL
jgi:Rieske Fe-S protein